MSSRGLVLNLRGYPLIGLNRTIGLPLDLHSRLKRRRDLSRQHPRQGRLSDADPTSKAALRDLFFAEVGDELLHAGQYAHRSYARQA